MGLRAFGTYQDLLKAGHQPQQMGFPVRAGDINRFANRLRLAREFEGLKLPTYAENTVRGYEAFVQVFLTHSALECFPKILGYSRVHELEPVIAPYPRADLLALIKENDPRGRLIGFIYKRVNGPLQKHLDDYRAGTLQNVGNLSAAIRHIFAHGHLTATGAGLNPRRVHRICTALSSFLHDFMDEEFGRRVEEYEAQVAEAQAP